MLYRNIKSPKDCQILQDDLNSLAQWETAQQKLEQVQSTKYLGIIISDNLDWFQIFRVKQLRQWVFFGAIWHCHLDTQRKLHTKHWFAHSSRMQLLFGIPIMKLRLHRWRRYRGQLQGGPAGDREIPVVSAICRTNLSGHPWRPLGSNPP